MSTYMLNKNYIIGGVVILAIAAGAIFWSRDNSGNTNAKKKVEIPFTITEKPTRQSQVAESKPEENRILPGKVIAMVVDQHGNLLGGKDFYPSGTWYGRIVDALGEQVIFALIENGYFESDKFLPPGEYTIFVPSDSYGNNNGSYDLASIAKKFQLTSEGINLGKLIVTRLASVKVRVVNEVGTELNNAYYLITNSSTSAVDTMSRPSMLLGGNSGLYGSDDLGAYLGDHFPAGSYTVQISRDGYIPTDKSFDVQGRTVDLGNIVLKKK